MKDNRLRILGLRCYRPNGNGIVANNVDKMQKCLKHKDNWTFFYQGITFEEANECFKLSQMFFNDSVYLYDNRELKISISAIVGINGAGKSTILDMILRVLNNFSAAAISEMPVYNAAEHLHYIDNVYASLLVYINGEIIELKIDGRHIELNSYISHANTFIFKKDDAKSIAINVEGDRETPIRESNTNIPLGELFYSLFFNYSLYSYSYRDYYSEITTDKKLHTIDEKKEYDEEDHFWLTGLFHKNDGYQTPVVINPMREHGLINGVRENYLAKERLLSMMFYTDGKVGIDGKKNYPFRTINETLHIEGFFVKPFEGYWRSKWKDKDMVCKSLGVSRQSILYKKNFEKVSAKIVEYVRETYKLNKNIFDMSQTAWDYIVYKVLKIAITYKRWNRIYNNIRSTNPDWGRLKQHIIDLSADYSHITVKLRRVISFLALGTYQGNGGVFKFEHLDDKAFTDKLKVLKKHLPNATLNDMLPPPVLDIDFIIGKSVDENTNDIINFEGLSSGERQIAYVVSNFVYHLVNINSAHDRKEKVHPKQASNIKYEYVNVVFDEIELYFHPDLQRRFISYLLSSLNNIRLPHIKGVNIILATHSPFILSDLPSTNVLRLWEDENKCKETFCANIHDMLSQSFFMEYTIGQKAQQEVERIAKMYNQYKDGNRNVVVELADKCRYIASIVADDYIGSTVKSMVKEMYGYVNVEERIKELESEIRKLRKRR